MICALLVGREGSGGFPGKNLHPLLGVPLVAYPLRAALASTLVDRVYVSTDSPAIKRIAVEHGAHVIDRPAHLASARALADDVFVHGYDVIRGQLRPTQPVELLVLLMANAATVTAATIDSGITTLRAHPDYDSAVTVSSYNMWSPLRARRIGGDGLLHPFVPPETFADPETLNCDRDSQGDVWFADMGASIVRPRCLEHVHDGLLPQKWMGQRIYPLKQWGGLDVDYEWQLPQVEFWVKAQGSVNTDRNGGSEQE